MAGETFKTTGIVLDIRPWSRTSHIVTWLTPERGPVATLIKGAVRPKSAFLGQYDLFYTCELVYYVRAKGDLHAVREAVPVEPREHLRGNFRSTALASYAAYLVKEHCPHTSEASQWFAFLGDFLDGLGGTVDAEREMVSLETAFLELAGLAPDFSDADLSAETVPFSIDLGHVGTGAKTVQLSPRSVRFLLGERDCAFSALDVSAAVRFLGLFIRYHLDMPPDIRRNTLQLGIPSSFKPLRKG
jgi:DNA repair protein RecO